MRPSRSSPLLAILIIVVGLAFCSNVFAFSATDYLYYNETADQIKVEVFTYQGVTYSLIKVGQRETFLLKNEALLTNISEIGPPIQSHYRETHYANVQELAEVYALLTEYNKSRNNGEGVYPNKEEFTCRHQLFLDGSIKRGPGEVIQCIDEESCKVNALLVFQAYNAGVGFGTVDIVLGPLKAFAFATQDVEKLMAEMFRRWGDPTEENIGATLQYIQDSIPALRSDESVVESSVFRLPKNTAEDRELCKQTSSRIGCYMLCPIMDYNETALSALEGKVSTALGKVQPFVQHDAIGLQIESETRKRFGYRDNEDKAVYYISSFEPTRQEGLQALQDGRAALAVVLNLSFKARVDRLEQLGTLINQSIEQRNFTAIDEYLLEYEGLAQSVEEGIPDTVALYNATVLARRDAALTVMLLESRDLSGSETTELQSLQAYHAQLDGVFQPGLTSEQYEEIKTDYGVVSQRARNTMQTHDQNPLNLVLAKLRSTARRFALEVSDLSDLGSSLGFRDLAARDTRSVYGLAALVFLSVGALNTVLVLTLLLGRSHMTGSAWISAVIVVGVLMAGSLVFSGLMGYYMGKTAYDASLSEFLVDFKSHPSVAIAMDAAYADNATSDAIQSCTGSLSGALLASNRTVTIYDLQDASCQRLFPNGIQQTTGNCTLGAGNESSLLVLNYSATPSMPHFRTVFSSQMDVAGDERYYKACAIALLFQG